MVWRSARPAAPRRLAGPVWDRQQDLDRALGRDRLGAALSPGPGGSGPVGGLVARMFATIDVAVANTVDALTKHSGFPSEVVAAAAVIGPLGSLIALAGALHRKKPTRT
jgi:hypothetical protein